MDFSKRVTSISSTKGNDEQWDPQESAEQKCFGTNLISISEFAAKIGAGRSTIYEWIKKGRLLPGRHFLKIGKKTRFEWGANLIGKLHEDSIAASAESGYREKSTHERRKGTVINLDYC